MQAKMNTYDAFISYRHTEPDAFVAAAVHHSLENARIPGRVRKNNKKQGLRTKITRVFRDEDELPLADNLEDPIIEALKNSEWLIVICSPRLKESKWCKKEIETFIELHGHDKILAVLAEGEPEDSFPEELTTCTRSVMGENGVYITETLQVEPLAADVRGENNRERKKKLKNEVLRLLAPMLQVNFDDLKQRAKEQRLRKGIITTGIIGAVSILFGLAAALAAVHIKTQSLEIQEQARRIADQSLEISNQAAEIQSQNELLKVGQADSLADKSLEYLEEDDRQHAVLNAYRSLTYYNGIEMPYTDDGLYALNQSFKPYYLRDSRATVDKKMYFDSRVSNLFYAGGDLVVVTDSNEYANICNVNTGEILQSVHSWYAGYWDRKFYYTNDEMLVYVGEDNTVYELNPEDGSLREILPAWNYKSDIDVIAADGRYIYTASEHFSDIGMNNTVYVYDYETGREIGSLEYPGCYATRIYTLGEGKFACVFNAEDADLDSDSVCCYKADENGLTLTAEILFENGNIRATSVFEDTLYVVYHESDSHGYDMLDDPDGWFDNYEEFKYIGAYDLTTGEEKWKYELETFTYEYTICPTSYDGTNNVTLLLDDYYYIFDGDTGEMGFANSAEGIVGSAYDDSYVYYFSENGDVHMIIPNLLTAINCSGSIICNLDNFDIIIPVDCGYVGYEGNTNNITVYKYGDYQLLTYCDEGEIQEVSTDKIYTSITMLTDYIDTDMNEFLDEAGIETEKTANAAMYFDDDQKLLVIYSDGEVCIYDTKKMEILESFKTESGFSIAGYAGEDIYGADYFYLSDYSYEYADCYVISESGSLIDIIPDIAGLADNGASIVINYNGEDYGKIAVYSLDQLLYMAEEYLNENLEGWEVLSE